MSQDIVLLDANVIIGARKGDPHCRAILEDARYRPDFYYVTPEIAEEVRMIPAGISVWQGGQEVGFNASALKAYIDKEYGGPGGSRRPPSRADKSLLEAARTDPAIRMIISSDRDLLDGVLLESPSLRKRTRCVSPEEYSRSRRFGLP